MSIHQIDGKSTLGVGQDVAIRREDAEVESQGIGEDRDHEQNSAEHEAEADEAEEEDQVPAVAPPTSTSAANARTTFGLKKPKPAINRGNDTYDYEQKYPEDAPYAETAPNARVWRTHEDESRIHGTNMVEEARDNVDVLLVFAGLFSAVVTTFVSQTYQNLQVDYAAMSASLLYESVLVQRAIANGSPVNSIAASPLNPTITFVPATTDVWVNGLWFTSLFLSLTTALVAVLVKQWLHHYVALPSGTPRDRSFTRQFRYAGFQKWHVPSHHWIAPCPYAPSPRNISCWFGNLLTTASASTVVGHFCRNRPCIHRVCGGEYSSHSFPSVPLSHTSM
ncbi:hypothetical protein EDD18DRAFT_521337 [Armillaria luteobubalina]|uniref:DUF6535 domain-containing protein n=1 Tax=Armillaria luteobubalina TaxID=153913 RepID=A0AA39PXU9_9AGAR|nr:hypothetical protein EDD18DRAFT_521337 [Armillaria luteobubalina]